MHIGILGATSQIAKDLVLSFARHESHALTLFARRPEVVNQWLCDAGLSGRYAVAAFDALESMHFEAIMNFVGVGDPAQAQAMGASIFDVTLRYDELALRYLDKNPGCRYLFLSSGAAYGTNFEAPADQHTFAIVPINRLSPSDWYAAAKLHAECRHRAMVHLNIIDVRVFNYFSHTQDMSARFLITDLLRAIRDGSVMQTASENIVRDYLHPSDFYRLIASALTAKSANASVDCYSRAPVDKLGLLAELTGRYGLRYELIDAPVGINATGAKAKYYSLNRRAADFGYVPGLSSIEGVVREFELALRSPMLSI